MTSSIVEKIEEANAKLKEVGEKLKAYKSALGQAASVFEELASSCALVIAQPYIEVDTRDIDG